jgi:hypothetical protein
VFSTLAPRGEAARDTALRLESRAEMPVKTDAIGKQWPAIAYEVGAEKIREFSDAIGAGSDVHRDHEAARSAGFRDLVAPPMFCVVYSARAMGPAILDPDIGMNLVTMLHGSQEFEARRSTRRTARASTSSKRCPPTRMGSRR